MEGIARGTFKVKLQPLPVEGVDAASLLGRMSIDKQIDGELEAVTQGQMLTAGTEVKGSAGYVAVERVQGRLHGREGSFALLHRGVMARGAPELRVSVVPDSGTGELVGLLGEFVIRIEGGQHFYEFSYTLAAG